MVGVESQYLDKMLPGLSEAALLGQRHAQTQVGIDIAGLEPECFGIVTDSLCNVSLVGQDRAQVIMGLRKVRLEAQSFQILRDGFLCLPVGSEHSPDCSVPVDRRVEAGVLRYSD